MLGASATPVAAASLPSGHFTWTGSAAGTFVVPVDLRLSSTWHDAKFNLDYKRYQQFALPLGTYVEGAQVTIVSRNRQQLVVAGAYYPGVRSARSPALSVAEALSIAANLRGGLVDIPVAVRELAVRHADLRLDPETGVLFYLVITGAPGTSRFQQINAQTGELLATWEAIDQINAGQGVGVKSDIKQLSSPASYSSIGNLTSNISGLFKLHSTDDNFIVYDAAGGNGLGTEMTDTNFGNDNKWNDSTQAAGVDAQYYAALTVQFYRDEFSWDWITQCPTYNGVRSVVHYDESPGGLPYDNAFWSPTAKRMFYGDGGTSHRPLSAGQDVVSHELSHGVTQCREDLDYRKDSGALNESFSDIMATTAEFVMEEPLSSNCWLAPGQTECADWLIGEDLAKTASGAIIRNLADPEAKGQPSHYADRSFQNTPPSQCSSRSDYCDVHRNNGIPNHAYYLLVNGGRNARCSGPTDPQADCDVMVPHTSLDHAAKIFFAGFGILPSNATMCDARNGTVAQAAVLYPDSATDIAATILAWQAVGLGANCDASTDFKVGLSDPTVELAPGGVGTTHLNLNRGLNSDQIHYATDHVGPARVDPSPPDNVAGDSSGTTITVTADNNAADGVYPILITATGVGPPHYAAASFVIDAEDPTASVTSVRFSTAAQQVSPGGSINLSIVWTASDAQSGIASRELDHSPNGSGWGSIGTTSPTMFPATDGSHQFQVIATDAVGNSATSSALVRTLTGFQEIDKSVVYTGTWLTNTEATAWGSTKYSTRSRATATLTFTGTDVAWVAQRGPKRGVANVFVDGVKTHVDLYSPTTTTERKVVFIASNLAPGQHTIKVKVMGTSGRPRVDVDGFFVLAA